VRDARAVSGAWYDAEGMRRFLRILLSAATVLWLVLCAASLALWVRSYWVADHVSRSAGMRASGEPYA
jgi:hypothetical protein